jgi:hypothetical protein
MAIAAALALGACADATQSHGGAGTWLAKLSSPNGAEGAAVVELVGKGILNVSTAGGGILFQQPHGDTMRVVAMADTSVNHGGTIQFHVKMAEGSAAPAATVLQVAAPNDALRGSLAGYRVDLSR